MTREFNYFYFFQLTTTEWTAPILAHANIAMTSSKIMGMYNATISPFCTPIKEK